MKKAPRQQMSGINTYAPNTKKLRKGNGVIIIDTTEV